ncbi:MAG: tail fiber domain-containing protein, partial [Candidatus Paceibacterota bacterium]
DVLASVGTGVIARFNSANATGCTLADGGTISCSSDINLKKNITDMGYGLDTLMSLRPVEYNWKSEADGNAKSLGFIAQEIEGVLPKLVTTDDNGLKQLNTIGLIPVLTKAVQELNDKISIQISGASNQVASGFEGILGWLTDKIITAKEFIADKITTKQLCLEDVCVTRDQLKALLDKNPTPPAPAPAPDPDPAPASDPAPAPDSTSSPQATPTPPAPSAVEGAPDPAPAP